MMQYEVHQFNFVETPRKTYHGKILIRKLGCSSYILSTILIFFEYMKSFDGEKTKILFIFSLLFFLTFQN